MITDWKIWVKEKDEEGEKEVDKEQKTKHKKELEISDVNWEMKTS